MPIEQLTDAMLISTPPQEASRNLRIAKAPAEVPSKGLNLRVVSANLYGGRSDAEAFAELVQGLEADVVAAQELSPAQAEVLGSVFPYGHLNPREDEHGMGVALRRPAKLTKLTLTYRDARVAVLDPQDWPELVRPLEVVNVHIAAPHVPPWPVGGIYHRRRQMRRLERYLSENGSPNNGVSQSKHVSPNQNGAATNGASAVTGSTDARIMVGDFNATPIWGVYRRIASHLTDAAIAVAQERGRPLRPTWGPWPGSRRWLRLDHGFVSGVDAESFEVVEIPGSDHSAIVIDLRLS